MQILKKLKKIFNLLGPGFITGAADDDPSGIATYSIAGAQFGYQMVWLTVFLVPLMVSIQEMCGRIGLVSGRGLAGAIKKHYPRKVLYLAVGLLFIANTINIGANLGIMAASLKMVLGLPFLFWLLFVTALTVTMEIYIPYRRYSSILKWFSLSLFAYVLTAFLSRQDWLSIIRYAIIPSISFNSAYLMTMVAFLGTTISLYLFFWQTGSEVEEEIAEGEIRDFNQRPITTPGEVKHLRADTRTGMVFSNLIAFFIILTTAGTLYAAGIREIETPQQAAQALRPLAGSLAYLLFTIGIIGIGLQSIPILAGAISYAFSETFGFKEGLGKKLSKAKMFYFIITVSTFLGAFLNFLGINVIKALYYTAIINGLVAVPLIAIIIKMANNEKIVGNYKTSKIGNLLGWTTFGMMGISSALLIFKLF